MHRSAWGRHSAIAAASKGLANAEGKRIRGLWAPRARGTEQAGTASVVWPGGITKGVVWGGRRTRHVGRAWSRGPWAAIEVVEQETRGFGFVCVVKGYLEMEAVWPLSLRGY